MSKKKKAAVVFIHGLAKKPQPEKLQEIWLWALERNTPKPEVFGSQNPGIYLLDQGIHFSFTYWADVFYGKNYETDYRDQYESGKEVEINSADYAVVAGELQIPTPTAPREARFLSELQHQYQQYETKQLNNKSSARFNLKPDDVVNADVPGQFEIASWLPREVKERVIRKAAMEAYYFLFDKSYTNPEGKTFQVRQELRERLLHDLKQAQDVAEKVVIVSHSMGTMIAYDVLRNVADCPNVNTLFTLGSPLGIQEVQDELRAIDVKKVDFPTAKLNQWINVYDPLDPICGLDPKFAEAYLSNNQQKIRDIKESNWGNWRHTATHYLAGIQFRKALAESLGINRL